MFASRAEQGGAGRGEQPPGKSGWLAVRRSALGDVFVIPPFPARVTEGMGRPTEERHRCAWLFVGAGIGGNEHERCVVGSRAIDLLVRLYLPLAG